MVMTMMMRETMMMRINGAQQKLDIDHLITLLILFLEEQVSYYKSDVR